MSLRKHEETQHDLAVKRISVVLGVQLVTLWQKLEKSC